MTVTCNHLDEFKKDESKSGLTDSKPPKNDVLFSINIKKIIINK